MCSVSKGMRVQRSNESSKKQMSTLPPLVVGFRSLSGVGVGWQRRCKKSLALRELDNQRTAVVSRFMFWRQPRKGLSFIMGGVETLGSAYGGW